MAVIYRDGRDNSEKRGIGYKCPGQLLCASCLTSGSLNTAKQKQTNKINWAMEMYVEKNV